MSPLFLNVDLEIESASKLDGLVEAMGAQVIVLHSGQGSKRRHFLALESSRVFKDADSTIHALCALIESLAPQTQRIWSKARKTLDIGYEMRTSERSSSCALRPDTLERMARLGVGLTVTFYSGDPNMTRCPRQKAESPADPKVSGQHTPSF